jgi:hypothetical protein
VNPLNSTYGSGSLPKPPLARRGVAMTITNDDCMTTTTHAGEQLLMLADAGIDKIKDAISKKKLPGNMMLPQVNEVVGKTRPGREPRATGNHQLTNNYNVSFNNSFNTL